MMRNKADKDRATLEAIGLLYCRDHHSCAKDDAGLCPECRSAVEATLARAQACPYGHVHNCQDCKTQCQRGEAKEAIRTIMRYSAPRMLLRHPLMTMEYLAKKRNGAFRRKAGKRGV